jgi:hypothetical protein
VGRAAVEKNNARKITVLPPRPVVDADPVDVDVVVRGLRRDGIGEPRRGVRGYRQQEVGGLVGQR